MILSGREAMMDPRNSYFGEGFQFLAAPDEEFDLSVCFHPGRDGPEGWPSGYRWRLESECGVLVEHNDLGGNPFLDVDHWLLPLTGYTRGEFLRAFGIKISIAVLRDRGVIR